MNNDILELCKIIKKELYEQENIKEFFRLKKCLEQNENLNEIEMKALFYKTCDKSKNSTSSKFYDEKDRILNFSNFKNIEEDVNNDIKTLKDIIKQ